MKAKQQPPLFIDMKLTPDEAAFMDFALNAAMKSPAVTRSNSAGIAVLGAKLDQSVAAYNEEMAARESTEEK